MKLNENQKKQFKKLIDKFSEDYGRDALKEVYKLHRKLKDIVDCKIERFPIAYIYHILLAEDFADKYKNFSIEEVAKAEQIPVRSVYQLYHNLHSNLKYQNKKK